MAKIDPHEIRKRRYLTGQEKMNPASQNASPRREKIENKANIKMGKICVSYYLTSKYEDFRAILCFMRLKTKPICLDTRDQMQVTRHGFV